jgi:hypothetical protein
MIKDLKFLKLAPTPAFDANFAVAERKAGIKFPPPFVEFCRKYNGGFPSRENSYYYVPGKFHDFHEEYGPAQLGVGVDGLCGIAEDFPPCDVFEVMKEIGDVAIRLFPIAYDLVGNQVVVKSDDPQGPVFWRDHELWQDENAPRLITIADSLDDYYQSLTEEPNYAAQ